MVEYMPRTYIKDLIFDSHQHMAPIVLLHCYMQWPWESPGALCILTPLSQSVAQYAINASAGLLFCKTFLPAKALSVNQQIIDNLKKKISVTGGKKKEDTIEEG